jgi:hypothetical protein
MVRLIPALSTSLSCSEHGELASARPLARTLPASVPVCFLQGQEPELGGPLPFFDSGTEQGNLDPSTPRFGERQMNDREKEMLDDEQLGRERKKTRVYRLGVLDRELLG